MLWLFLGMFFAGHLSAYASDLKFLGGSLNWRDVTEISVEFTVTQTWQTSGPPSVTVGSVVTTGALIFGDGTSEIINLTVTSVNPDENWFTGEAKIRHTYPSRGATYWAFFAGCCRSASLVNNAGQGYYIGSSVPVSRGMSPPAVNMPPFIKLPAGQANARFLVPGHAGGGPPATFSLATSADLRSASFSNAPGLEVNSSTGEVTFNTVGASAGQRYNAVIKVSGLRSSVLVDFVIQITESMSGPIFDYSLTPAHGKSYTLAPGETVQFTVRAAARDSSETIQLKGLRLPAGATLTPTLPAIGNPVQSVFSWTPSRFSSMPQTVYFVAEDSKGGTALTGVTFFLRCTLGAAASITHVSCGTGGAVDLSLMGGLPPYRVRWTGPRGFRALTEDISGLESGAYSVTVTDAQECVVSMNIEITGEADVTPPVVLASGFTVVLDKNGQASIQPEDVDYGSFDTCSGIASMTLSKTTFDCADVGNNPVTLTVTDGKGNSASQTVTIVVQDKELPTLRVARKTVYLVNGKATLRPEEIDQGTSDNCGIASLSISRTTFTCTDLDPRHDGFFPITFTATDIHGNSVSTTVFLTLVDATPPTVLGAGFAVALVDGKAIIQPEDVDYGSFDDCGVASMSLSKTSFTCADLGPNDVTLTVRDHSGNSTSAVVTINITGSCPATTSVAASGITSKGQEDQALVFRAYPNPVMDQATIHFRSPEGANTKLLVYNSLGSLVATLFEGQTESGQDYQVTLDSRTLASGVYFCRLIQGGKVTHLRVLVDK
ncbi:T9SS type A sorting domain-containing protein [Rufibacter glacialis]|uniref:T9SS type A sorting domain-containing protein n=1 Tax=Rufibacter glacialis TaxID=1259555 RepID=A0ABV4RH92_9BACT|nr:T9SS type A sorting domain-containing protein [Rufibacter glacialis]